MAEAFPEALAAFLADPVAHHPPGGEHPPRRRDRAVDCLQEAARTFPDGRVLVVAHSTLLRLVLCRLLGIPSPATARSSPPCTTAPLTELRLRDGQASPAPPQHPPFR